MNFTSSDDYYYNLMLQFLLFIQFINFTSSDDYY